MADSTHIGLHECDHKDCSCLWCRISRREDIESISDTMEVKGRS